MGISARCWRPVSRCCLIFSRRSVSVFTRLPMRRRSVSSCVSPGPRLPMPPPRWRSRWLQARRDVLELRELDFELAFVTARALREDVEDQSRAVEHATLYQLLEIAFLGRRQRVIEQHDFGVVRGGRRLDLF